MAENTVPTTTESRTPTAREDTREESRYLIPPVDIYEQDDALVVVADLPGVDKDGLSVGVEEDILTIRGQGTSDFPGETVRTEFELMNFYRQFRLGSEVDQDRIQAELKHGVLKIRLPKAEKAKPKQIAVNFG